MQTGKFGSKVFEVNGKRVLTFEELSISSSLSTSSEDAAQGKKAATKVKSPGLIKVSLSVSLRAALGVDVAAEMDAWQTICAAGVPYPLVICGRAVSVNKFLLTDCAIGDVEIYPAKQSVGISSAKVKLEFVEFLPPGLQSTANQTSTGQSAAGTSAAVTVSNAYNMPTASEKAAVKRENTGMGG